jgi:2-oxo-4-hydroxy-4-carboxy-5-ureidoimidazoline decarboxylase
MTLDEFNAASPADARGALLRCCGSSGWSDKVLSSRPFSDAEALLSTAESVWWTLGEKDWLEAFSAHPRIGEKKHSAWSSREQSGIDSASVETLDRLAKGNVEYEDHFGWIFLVNATGKSAREMLALLEARLQNSREEELRVAAGEQAKITTLRLAKLLHE